MKLPFFKIAIGLSSLILSISLFLNSIGHVNAGNHSIKGIQTNGIGKYMMSMTHSDAMRIIIWDTETGNSVIYTRGRSGFHVIQQDQLPPKLF